MSRQLAIVDTKVKTNQLLAGATVGSFRNVLSPRCINRQTTEMQPLCRTCTSNLKATGLGMRRAPGLLRVFSLRIPYQQKQCATLVLDQSTKCPRRL